MALTYAPLRHHAPSCTGSNDTGAFVLLRVYAFDKLSPNKTDIWGAVKPPVVRYKASAHLVCV